MQCQMDHIVLNVEDDEKMIQFYAQVLALPTERVEEYRTGKVAFPSLRLNRDTIIDLFPKELWQGSSSAGPGLENMNHFCLTVDRQAWNELCERLRTHGISIKEGPVARWGARGTGTSIYFYDPEDNLIEVRYYEPNSASTD